MPLPLARRADAIRSSAIDDMTSVLAGAGPDVISLAVGSPAPEAVPASALAALAGATLTEPSSLGYAPSEGDHGLRRRLLALLEERGEPVASASLLVTSGGMQGLDLACKLFLDPGDVVVTEAPTYTNGLGTIRSYQGEVVGVPVDACGLCVDQIPERLAGRRPKLFYVIPNYQNPSGTTLPLARRQRLLELAREHDAVILEDDPYGWLHFDQPPPASLWALDDGGGRVVSVSTFSKLVAPGLRVGWLRAAPEVVERMIAAKQAVDSCVNTPAQRLLDELIADGDFDHHLERLRRTYRERQARLQTALHDHLDGVPGATWTRVGGGFFVWLQVPGCDAEALLPAALREGVAYVPGSAFAPHGGFENCFRLGFSAAPADRLDEAVRRLRRVLPG